MKPVLLYKSFNIISMCSRQSCACVGYGAYEATVAAASERRDLHLQRASICTFRASDGVPYIVPVKLFIS